jgi:Uma2 family endonuclease
MSNQINQMTVNEFREYAERPENSNRILELINSKIVEKPPGTTRNSEYGLIIAFAVRLYCRTHNLPCHTSGADGTYSIDEHVVVPDFAFKTTPMSDEYPDPTPPLWMVEIISPSDKAPAIRDKRQIYIQAGILYWEVYPQSKSIDVYAPGQPAQTIGMDGELDGGTVLPGFTLAVSELFAE